MKAIVFDASKCNGCYGCQLACKDEHVDNDWRPFAAPQPDTGHFWCRLEEITHGQVPKVRIEYRPYFCNHCDDAPCIAFAPEEVYRRPDGLVIIDPDKARGNRNLVDICPYEAIFWNEEQQMPQKCTGCAHLVDEGMMPHCVDVCATGALRFGDDEEFSQELNDAIRLTDDHHGGHVHYRNLPKLFVSGDVWDPKSDEIIEGVAVTLSGAGVSLNTKTDGFGDFWFKDLDKGGYELRIDAAGYKPAFKVFILEKSLNIGDFPLTRL
jgi:Fe-S-cluster-containing dehydrogenase component